MDEFDELEALSLEYDEVCANIEALESEKEASASDPGCYYDVCASLESQYERFDYLTREIDRLVDERRRNIQGET